MLKGIDRQKLADRIMTLRPYFDAGAALRVADGLIADTDPRLEANVREWSEGRPLSPIVYTCKNGEVYSVQGILDRYATHDFLSALKSMELFFTNEAAALLRVKRVFR